MGGGKAQRPGEGMPHEYTAESRELRSAAIVAVLFSAAVLLIVGGVFFYSRVGSEAGPPRAVIVDQLSLTAPNPEFAVTATELLEEAGYVVDYYPGEEVTVEFYRGLPALDYDMIILRIHAARYQDVVRSSPIDLVELFTSEPYSPTKYAEERRLGRLGAVAYYEGGDEYFAIGPRFITGAMSGEFNDTTVIMMGCNGLSTSETAEAFIRKGAETFISWSDFVSASHTDAATERLLEGLLIEELSVEDAVAETMGEVGPDPFYDSVLLSYPPER